MEQRSGEQLETDYSASIVVAIEHYVHHTDTAHILAGVNKTRIRGAIPVGSAGSFTLFSKPGRVNTAADVLVSDKSNVNATVKTNVRTR